MARPFNDERDFLRMFPRVGLYKAYVRFMRYMRVGGPDDCWEWHGRLDEDGYGAFSWKAKNIHSAHVAAYVLFVGQRHGLCVCHSCDNRKCVNPSHLWLGTNAQNVHDMISKGRDNFVGARPGQYKGEKNPNVKLRLEDVELVRAQYREGGVSYGQLAKRFGISKGMIAHIVKERSWVN